MENNNDVMTQDEWERKKETIMPLIENEGDKKEFTYKGYKCAIERQRKGFLVCYIIIGKDERGLGENFERDGWKYCVINSDQSAVLSFGKNVNELLMPFETYPQPRGNEYFSMDMAERHIKETIDKWITTKKKAQETAPISMSQVKKILTVLHISQNNIVTYIDRISRFPIDIEILDQDKCHDKTIAIPRIGKTIMVIDSDFTRAMGCDEMEEAVKTFNAMSGKKRGIYIKNMENNSQVIFI